MVLNPLEAGDAYSSQRYEYTEYANEQREREGFAKKMILAGCVGALVTPGLISMAVKKIVGSAEHGYLAEGAIGASSVLVGLALAAIAAQVSRDLGITTKQEAADIAFLSAIAANSAAVYSSYYATYPHPIDGLMGLTATGIALSGSLACVGHLCISGDSKGKLALCSIMDTIGYAIGSNQMNPMHGAVAAIFANVIAEAVKTCKR